MVYVHVSIKEQFVLSSESLEVTILGKINITNATTTNLTKVRFKKFLKDKFDADMNWLAEK